MLNKLINGDCIEEMRKLERKSIPLILTDIPYDVVNRESSGIRNFDKGNADTLEFDLQDFLFECNRLCSGSIYIFCSSEQVSNIRKTLIKYDLTTRHCIWNKTNPSPVNGQYLWLSSIENCIFARNKGATFNEHCKGSVWNFSTVRSKIHPTEKPTKLLEYLISTSSNPGDVVLDPLFGSGSTLLAAKNLSRDFIGIEKDEKYYKAAIERLA
jgi:site-specific DNA-methyltransferase (adenine-specific)